MSFFKCAFGLIYRVLPAEEGHAHCDIPCGIYDPIQAKIAAQTVQKMVMRIQSLNKPGPNDGGEAWAAYENNLDRYVQVKEEHAQVCKKELLILWSDYFKPEHLEKHSDLHDTYWQAAKLCSTNKQTVNLDAAKQLVDTVDKLSGIFWATKGVTWKDEVATVRFGT